MTDKEYSVEEILKILEDYSKYHVQKYKVDKFDSESLKWLRMLAFTSNEWLDRMHHSSAIPFKFREYCNKHLSIIPNDDMWLYNIICGANYAYYLNKFNKNKIFYKFDKDIEQDLIFNSNTFELEKFPIELFKYLPHDNFFVATPGISFYIEEYTKKMKLDKDLIKEFRILGFFFDKDYTYGFSKNKREIIRTDLVYSIAMVYYLPDNILKKVGYPPLEIAKFRINKKGGNISLTNSIMDSVEEGFEKNRLIIKTVLPYIFYLCSENSVIRERESKEVEKKKFTDKKKSTLKLYQVSAPKQEGHLLRKFPPSKVIKVNRENVLRKGSLKCPHERRSHWHSYWIGKRDSEERRLILKWVSAMRIHPELDSSLITTEIKVSE